MYAAHAVQHSLGGDVSFGARVGRRIRMIRKAEKITIRTLDHRSGISANHIIRIEAGQISNPGLDTIRKLAKGLDRPMSHLMDDERGRRPALAR